MKPQMTWALWALGSACAWGVWGILNKLTLARAGWPVLILCSGVVYVVASVPVLIWAGAPRTAGPTAWALGFAAAVTGAAGMVLFYFAFQGGKTPASAVVPLTALYPAVTAVIGIWALGERLAPAQYVGMALAVVAAALLAWGK